MKKNIKQKTRTLLSTTVLLIVVLCVISVFLSDRADAASTTWLYHHSGVFGGNLMGEFPCAIQLTPDNLSVYDGYHITSIRIYNFVGDNNGNISIYANGDATDPGELTMWETYTGSGATQWQQINLTTPVLVDSTHYIWVAVTIGDMSFDNNNPSNEYGNWYNDSVSWVHTVGVGTFMLEAGLEYHSLGNVNVDDDADPGWYDATHVKTIWEGYNNASAGQTVYVYNGTYYESYITIINSKPIIFQGENRDTTIINGSITGNEIFNINASNVSISGFTIEGAPGHQGIRIRNNVDLENILENITISDCIIRDNGREGIYFLGYGHNISNCSISDCVVYNNGWGNIRLVGTVYTNISNCTVYNSGTDNVGILIEEGFHNVVSGCHAYGNQQGLVSQGLYQTVVNCSFYDNIDYGLQISGTNGECNNIVEDCLIYNNTGDYGLTVSGGSGTIVTNCSVYGNKGGFDMERTPNSIITNCSIYSHSGYYGIKVASSSNSTWRNNTLYNNSYQEFYVWGDDTYDFYQDIDTSNTIRGKPMYYYVNQDDAVVDEIDAGFIGLVSCDNASVSNLDVSHVLLAGTTNSTVDNVTIWYSSPAGGVYLFEASNNHIMNCNVSVSTSGGYALYLKYSYLNNFSDNNLTGMAGVLDMLGNNNTFMDNTISDCMYGIYFASDSDNLVFHNNFLNNTVFQAYDEVGTNNDWDNGATIGGNYWSDFHNASQGAYDNNSDGFADKPYNVTTDTGFTQDNYPLMNENQWWRDNPVTRLHIEATRHVTDVLGIADAVNSIVGVILIILSIMGIIAIVSKFGT